MALLQNAIPSIHVGLEDSTATGTGRLLSAVRNLHAGILLLYKEKLRRLSPAGSNDVLIKQRTMIQKAAGGILAPVGVGNKTVDTRQIEDHFASLGIKTDWKRFHEIARLRNEIEHYFTTVSPAAIQGAISNTFLIIRNFIHDELEEDPTQLLKPEDWATLLRVSEVFEQERKTCREALAAVNWKSPALAEAILELTCAQCGSPLLHPVERKPETNLRCRSCGEDSRFDHYAERAISEFFSGPNHLSIKDGGDPLTIDCPYCGADAYVIEENECVVCGETCATTCSVCDNTIPVCELSDDGRCAYCIHMANKDD